MQYQPALAILVAAILGFSCTTFIPLISPGYVDPATFFFILLVFTRIKQPIVSATCFSLALLNHESVVFLFPAILGYAYFGTQELRKTFRFAGLMLLAIVPYATYRLWINVHQEVSYSTQFYFSYANIRECLSITIVNAPMAAFYAFGLFWFFPYLLY